MKYWRRKKNSKITKKIETLDKKHRIILEDCEDYENNQIGWIYIIECGKFLDDILKFDPVINTETKIYVGQTSGPLSKRHESHCKDLKEGKHYNIGLQFCCNSNMPMRMYYLEKVFSNGADINKEILKNEEEKWMKKLKANRSLNILTIERNHKNMDIYIDSMFE